MIICLKGISEEGFSISDNLKIINANLKFLTKVPTQIVKINLYKNQIHLTDL